MHPLLSLSMRCWRRVIRQSRDGRQEVQLMSDDPNDTNEINDEQAMLPFDDGSMGRLIRRQWHEGRWYFSVIDVIAVLTDSDAPRRYWSDLKRKLHDDEGFSELYEKIVQL